MELPAAIPYVLTFLPVFRWFLRINFGIVPGWEMNKGVEDEIGEMKKWGMHRLKVELELKMHGLVG